MIADNLDSAYTMAVISEGEARPRRLSGHDHERDMARPPRGRPIGGNGIVLTGMSAFGTSGHSHRSASCPVSGTKRT